jgi:glutathione S-transferase
MSRDAVAASSSCVLVTIPISHFCEKARWALERAGIRYEERAHLQVLHRFAVRRAGGGTTAPVLVCGERVLADSSDILELADARAPEDRRLYPRDPGEAEAVMALQRDFDQRLGPEARRWMYNELHGRKDLALAYGCTGVPAWQRRIFPLAYRPVEGLVMRFLDVSPATAARSERDVRETFDRVGEQLADGRPYICGESFTAADLTFSALAAAVLVPPEYGVPLPPPDELPTPMAAVVRELREHPAGAHAMRMYREQRHPA